MKRLSMLWICLSLLFLMAAGTGVLAQQDMGDAPEGALAYPSTGVIGSFPTCIYVTPAGFIAHYNPGLFFGLTGAPSEWDPEPDGNGGLCPVFSNNYDADECFSDGDSGLLFPEPFTITGPPGSETVIPCPGSMGTPLGVTCTTATWGMNIDIAVQNQLPFDAYLNVLMDWNQNGAWGGSSLCPNSLAAPEHVLVNFLIPAGFSGPVSFLTPPGFVIGPNGGYVWCRFTLTSATVPADWDGSFEDGYGETEDYLFEIMYEEPTPTPSATPSFTPTTTPTPTATHSEDTPTPTPTIGHECDFGDAPEGVTAYPSLGIQGMFPTCIGTGPNAWIQHRLCQAYFGASADFEIDGNAGLCPLFSPYDDDECFQDADAGLLIPDVFTISGGSVVPCPGSSGTIPLGTICQQAVWGTNIDILVTNTMPFIGYFNLLIDWDQNGTWGGVGGVCPSESVMEHAIVNFPIPSGFSGPLSLLLPPNFTIGPNSGYVWCRFSITELLLPDDWNGEGIFENGETEDYLLWIIDERTPTPTATPTVTPTPPPIPSMGGSGALLLILILGGLLVFHNRKRLI